MATQTTLATNSNAAVGSRGITRFAPIAARLMMGAIFFIFGLNGFFNFIPQPPPPPAAMSFMGALAATGYMFPLIKVTEITVGLLLLSNRFVTLALALIAPIIVNIVAFHAALAPAGLPVAIMVLALEVYLAWTNRAAYRPMLATRAK